MYRNRYALQLVWTRKYRTRGVQRYTMKKKKKKKKGAEKKKKIRSTETVDEFLHFQTALACAQPRASLLRFDWWSAKKFKRRQKVERKSCNKWSLKKRKNCVCFGKSQRCKVRSRDEIRMKIVIYFSTAFYRYYNCVITTSKSHCLPLLNHNEAE